MRRIFRFAPTCFAILLAATAPVHPQEPAPAVSDQDAEKIAEKVRETLKDAKFIEVGFSAGARVVLDREDELLRDAVILPTDNSLQVDAIDRTDFIISAVVAAYPLKDLPGWWSKLGFVANLNLAEFGPGNAGVFNKSIEGGLGISVRLVDDFALALTWERVSGRELRTGIVPGQPIMIGGEPLQAIDVDDDRFFKDDNLSALSFKFVYFVF